MWILGLFQGSGWRRASPMEWAVAPLIVTTQWRGDVESENSEHILADGVNGTCLQWQVLFIDIGCVVPGYLHVFTCIYMYLHVFTCIYMYLHVFTCIYRFAVLTWYGRTPCVDLSIWWEITGCFFSKEHWSFHQQKFCCFSKRQETVALLRCWSWWLQRCSAALVGAGLMTSWHDTGPSGPCGASGFPGITQWSRQWYLGSVQLCNSFENETNWDIFDIFVSASDFDIGSHLLQAIQLFGISSEWFQRASATCDRGRWQIGSGLLWQLGRGIWTFRTKLGWGRRLFWGRGEAFEVGHESACQKEIWSHFHLLYPKSPLPAHKNQLGLSQNLELPKSYDYSSTCCSAAILYDLCIFGYPPFEASRYLSHYLKYITFFPYKMVTNEFISQFHHQHPNCKDAVSLVLNSIVWNGYGSKLGTPIKLDG